VKSILSNPLLKPLLGGGGSKVFQILVMFSVNLLLARSLDVEQFGLFSVAFSTIALGMIVLQFGFPNFLIKSAANSVDAGARLEAYLVSLFLAVLICGLVLIAAFVYLGSKYASDDIGMPFILLVLVASFAGAVTVLSGALLRANGKLLLGQLSDQVLVPTVFCLLTFYFPKKLDVTTVVGIYACAQLFGLAAVVWLIRKNLHFQRTTCAACLDIVSEYKRIFLMAIFAFIMILQPHLPVFVLYALSDVTEVTYFRIGFLLSLGVTLLAFPLNMIAGPVIARAARDGSCISLYLKLNPLVRLMFFLGIVFSIAVFLMPEEIIRFTFGVSYTPAAVVVITLIVSGLISLFFGPVALVLTMYNHELYVAKAMIAGVLSYFIMLIVLVPTYGSNGAAWSTVVSTLIWKILMYKKVMRVIGYDCTILGFGKRLKTV